MLSEYIQEDGQAIHLVKNQPQS